jgi:hypothetical protein
MRAARLGDDIDDFCIKCKRVMNHSVVSILNDAPAKVRCRTCHSDHDFRNEQPPPPKVDPRKAALFNQVLGNVTGLPPEVAPVAAVVDSDVVDSDGDAPDAEPGDPEGPAAEAVEEVVEAKPKGRKKSKA